jgi:hypothetical protein
MIVTHKLSKQGAIVTEGRHRIPQFAKVTLDNWALQRVRDLKLVTKAHKYTFPFHDRYHHKRAYRKVFEVFKKQFDRQIPYAVNCIVPFMDIGSATSENIIFRIGPYDSDAAAKSILKYLSRLNRLIRRESIPFSITARRTDHSTPDHNRYVNVLEIKVTMNRVTISDGYLILFFAPQIIKAIETLHRKAVYVA